MTVPMKYDINNTYVSEVQQYQVLVLLGASRTSTGNPSWTSTSSGVTYTVGDNSGQDGLMALIKTAVEDYLITADNWNELIEIEDSITQVQGNVLDQEKLAYYNIRNKKLISDGQTDWIDKNWTNADSGTSAIDSTNYLTGSNYVKITASAGGDGAHVIYTGDLTKFDDGGTSSTDDYIVFPFFVTAADLANMDTNAFAVQFWTSTFGDVSHYNQFLVTKASITADTWMFFVQKKSAFTSHSFGGWSALTGYDIEINRTAGTPSLTVGYIHMVRCDPNSAIPNYFQTLVNGSWVADYTPESGAYHFLGWNLGDLCYKEITNSNGDSRRSSLKGAVEYIDFNAYCKYIINGTATDMIYFDHMVDDGTAGIVCYLTTDDLYLIERHANSNLQTVSLDIGSAVVAGDIVELYMVKKGASVWVIVTVNGVKSQPLSMILTTIGNGTHTFYQCIGSEQHNHNDGPTVLCNYITTSNLPIPKQKYHAITTISASVASVTIPIPQSIRNGKIIMKGLRSVTNAGTWYNLMMRVNGDTGSNYHYNYISGTGAETAAILQQYFGYSGGEHTNVTLEFNNIATIHKMFGTQISNESTAGGIGCGCVSWNNATDRIKYITIYSSIGNIDAGTIEVVEL